MIPGIEEILAGLLSGQYTQEQAIGWLYTHVDLARDAFEEAALRDDFAKAAMQGAYSDSTRPQMTHSECARNAYVMADAMMEARTV